MKIQMLLLVAVGALTVPCHLAAQGSEPYSGRYSTVTISQDTIRPLTGQMILEQHYILTQLADDAGSPFDNLTGRCWGSVIFARDGDERTISAAGSCHFMDADGSGYHQWWQWRDAGTPECPIRCGIYENGNGYGRFAGLSETGTWNLEALLPGMSATGRAEGTVQWR
jgi:hypothetical protein